MNATISKSLISLALIFGLSACDSSDDDDINTDIQDDVVSIPASAMVQTVAPDYTTSEVVAIELDSLQVTTGYYIKAQSDYTVTSYNSDVYHLGRYFIDSVTKYSADNLDSEVWSYSTQDSGDSTSRNLYTLAFASETEAYIVRYGSDKIWIVNPEATTAEEFKTGELDLSAYVENNSNSTPRPSAAVVHDGKLFVVMQRLDDNWSAQTAYVAVFDTTTGEEIETNASDTDTVKGIPLTGFNPLEESLTVYEDTLYVTTSDTYSSADKAYSKIESIDTETYELATVLTAAELNATEVASIQMNAIVNDELGYFATTRAVSYDPYTEASTLYAYNPSTGEVIEEGVAGTGDEDINFIELDQNDFLWVGIGSTIVPGIDIIDTETSEQFFVRLLTDLNPSSIAFLD